MIFKIQHKQILKLTKMAQQQGIIHKPNLIQDNTYSQQRSKQILFWNLYALSNIHSISQLFFHASTPAEHTQKDHEWKDLFFFNKENIKGQQRRDTFISRAQRYLQPDKSIRDQIAWMKSEQFQLKVIKHSFWNKIRKMRPHTKEQAASKKILSNVMWKQRAGMIIFAIIFGVVFNTITGIVRLSFGKRIGIFGGCLAIGEFFFRYKKSDQIFYGLTKLPDSSLEEERLQILRECLLFDGRANNYGAAKELDQQIDQYISKQKTIQQQQKLAQSLNYKVIRQEDL